MSRGTRTGLWLGLAAAGMTVAVWVPLALASGLTFHLLPAAPPLVGALAYRAAGGERRMRAGLALATVGLGMSVIGAAMLAAAGGHLDAASFTILTQLAGAAAAIALLTRIRQGSPIGG